MTPKYVDFILPFGKGFYFAEDFFHVFLEMLTIENHAKPESERRDQNISRENHPEPRPIFFLTCVLPNGNDLEEVGAENRKELPDCVVFARAPNIRGVLIIDMEHIITSQRNKAELALENLVEHNKQHQQKQACGSAQNALIRKLVLFKEHQKQRHCEQHPMMIIESDNIQCFCGLVYFCQGLLRVEKRDEAAEDTDIEHIIFDIFVLDEEEKGEKRDIRAANINEPRIAEFSCFIYGVGRYVCF